MKNLIPACQSGQTFLFVSQLLTFRNLREIKSVQERLDYNRREIGLSKERKREQWGRIDYYSTCSLSNTHTRPCTLYISPSHTTLKAERELKNSFKKLKKIDFVCLDLLIAVTNC